jgi:hypothetical protein
MSRDLMRKLPPDRREALRAGHREDLQAATAFARACAEGEVDKLYCAHQGLNESSGCDAWRLAMAKVARLERVSPEIKAAFLNIWIESKMLPLRVGHRRTMANALRVLMPGDYAGPPLTLYRGTHQGERRTGQYGFSWTNERATARSFAKHWAQSLSEGALLQTVAPPEAILLVRKPEDYYDEDEVVVDPYHLGRVTIAERLVGGACEKMR